MNKVLLVEGDVDDAFFDSLFRKLEKGEGVEVRVGGGVPEIFKCLKALVRTGFRQVGIALDMNDKDEEYVYRRVFDVLSNEFGTDCLEKISSNKMNVKGTSLIVLPLGIKEEPLLQEFGVKKHEVEDYVMKILKEDNNLIKTLSNDKFDSNALIDCLRKARDSLKPKCIELISSKQLIDLIQAIIGFRASPATFAKGVVSNSNSKILENVTEDLMHDLRNW
jgi:hypothetical protein